MTLLRKIILVSPLCALLTASCEKGAMPPVPDTDPQAVFTQLWEGIDRTYSLFGHTDVDWDEVKLRYASSVHPDMGDEKLYEVLSKMLFELRDAHTNLYPGPDDRITRMVYDYMSGYPVDYNNYVVSRHYLLPNDPVTIHSNYEYCILRGSNIGYMLFDGYFRENTTEADFIAMLAYFKDTRGMILDIRNNGGGDTEIMRNMLSHFTDRKRLVGYVKHKGGTGRNDFTGWEAVCHSPRAPYYSKPVVLLTNRGVYSAANDMAMFAHAYPGITVVGSRTGGGIGLPVRRFLSNGWSYRTSFSVTATPDGAVYPDGMEPDVEQHAYYVDMSDDIIERAVEVIRELNPDGSPQEGI